MEITMIFDRHTMFSEDEAVTATGACALVVDCGPGLHKACTPPNLVVLANGYTGTGKLDVELQGCDNLNFASDVKTLAIFPLTNTELARGGKLLATGIPHTDKRYLRLKYTVNGTISGGIVNAGLVADA